MSYARSPYWKWSVCLLLLFATMLLYMDRQTLSLTATRMKQEFHLDNAQYGRLEAGFSWAFALGALFFGFLADRVSVRWLYPFVLVMWSAAGLATAYSRQIGSLLAGTLGESAENLANREIYIGLLFCRTALGLFESGQWPCALITTQRILSREDRSFGNSILQSGASIGAILTPFVVQFTMTETPGSWRTPFLIVGGIGFLWVFPWFGLVRGRDIAKPDDTGLSSEGSEQATDSFATVRRYVVLVFIVIAINMTWQFFRAWLPKFLKEAHDYSEAFANYFTAAYYVATDLGCLAVGYIVKQLASHGWNVHRARLVTFLGCSLLTSLGVIAALASKGLLLLGLLLLIGAGALGLFPNYYAFGQEISQKHQGLVVGSLGTFAWLGTGLMQERVGQTIQATGSYVTSMTLMGLTPLAAFVALWLFWDWPMRRRAALPCSPCRSMPTKKAEGEHSLRKKL
ncbi:MAG: MFS transporter [Acidimicrobiia bacterium]|nr:MFS transporter [Acidimicrobiia bacterium]